MHLGHGCPPVRRRTLWPPAHGPDHSGHPVAPGRRSWGTHAAGAGGGPGRKAWAGRWPATRRNARMARTALVATSSHGSHRATENSATTAGATTPGTVKAY